MDNFSPLKKKLEKEKEEVEFVLKELGLENLVKTEEIEKALKETDYIYEHYLGLGVIMRCLMENRKDLLEKWLRGLSAWKNLTPHDDLGGLSPFEYEKLYPRGPEEKRIMAELIKSYEKRLVSLGEKIYENFDIEKDFQQFQEEFLSLIPTRQPFPNFGRLLSNKEIIIEERKLRNFPKDRLEKIGITLGRDAIPELLGERAAQIEDNYYQCTKELELMRENPQKRDWKKVLEIYSYFLEIEPFMKCLPQPWRFYNNKGSVEFLLDLKMEALNSFELSLSLNPKQKYPQIVIEQIKKSIKKTFKGRN